MNYYPHNIGDYAAATRGLSLLEHGVYRALLDLYYLDEEPLTANPLMLCRLVGARSEEEQAAVRFVAGGYFEEQDGLLHHKRCDEEIAKYQSNVERGRVNGLKGGRPRTFGGDVLRETKPKPNPKITQALGKQETGNKKQKTRKAFFTPSETESTAAPESTEPALNQGGEQASSDSHTQQSTTLVEQTQLTGDTTTRQTAVEDIHEGNDPQPSAKLLNTPGQGGDGDALAGDAPGDATDPGDPVEPPPEKLIRRTYMPKDFGLSERVRNWALRKGHDRLEQRLEYFTSYAVRCAAKYADWDEALMTSIRDDWAKLKPHGAMPVSYLGDGDIM